MDDDLRDELTNVAYEISSNDSITLVSAKGQVVAGMNYDVIINVGEYTNVEFKYFASLPDDDGIQDLEIQEILTTPPEKEDEDEQQQQQQQQQNGDETSTTTGTISGKKTPFEPKCKPFQTACVSTKQAMYRFGIRIAGGIGAILLVLFLISLFIYDKNRRAEKDQVKSELSFYDVPSKVTTRKDYKQLPDQHTATDTATPDIGTVIEEEEDIND